MKDEDFSMKTWWFSNEWCWLLQVCLPRAASGKGRLWWITLANRFTARTMRTAVFSWNKMRGTFGWRMMEWIWYWTFIIHLCINGSFALQQNWWICAEKWSFYAGSLYSQVFSPGQVWKMPSLPDLKFHYWLTLISHIFATEHVQDRAGRCALPKPRPDGQRLQVEFIEMMIFHWFSMEKSWLSNGKWRYTSARGGN